MLLSEFIKKYGDLEITGFKQEDRMLNSDEVMKIIGVSKSEAYKIITKLKHKNRLQYEKAIIPKSVLFEYFGMNFKGENYE